MSRKVAICLILCLGLAGATRAADVTVAKVGGDYTSVQAGLDAAGPGGTVTILDSETYVEDVSIWPGTHDGVTLQAAPGQRPTILAANGSQRWTWLPLTVDRVGFIIAADATLIGLKIQNADTTLNELGVATAMVVQGSDVVPLIRVTIRDCHIVGPGVDVGDYAGAGIISWSVSNWAEVIFEDCEFYDINYGCVPTNFGPPLGLPPFHDCETTLTNCTFRDTLSTGYEQDAGTGTLVNCTVTSNSGAGIFVGGGACTIRGTDITDNADEGIELSWDSNFNQGRTNYPNVTMVDCLIARNRGSSREASVRVNNGWLTMDHCIVSQPVNTSAIYMDDNGSQFPCVLMANFCDFYARGPGGDQDIYWSDQDVKEHPIELTIKNSILVGRNGIINDDPGLNPMSVTYSDIYVTDVATSGVTTANNVSIAPNYLLPFSGTREGFRYTNANLNVGEGGAEIGSQGRYIPPEPLRVRVWSLYN